MSRKTTEELVKIAEARLKELKQRNSAEQRKKRTKRLIETGALIEKALEMEFDTNEKREALLTILTEPRQENNNTSYTYGSNLRKMIKRKTAQDHQYGNSKP